MFNYEFEKRPPSCQSFGSRSTKSAEWSRSFPNASRTLPNAERARRPLPPRPIMCETIPNKNSVPLRVWILASASCFGVCAVLVLATLVITKYGTEQTYTTKEVLTDNSNRFYNYAQIQSQIAEKIAQLNAQSNNKDKNILEEATNNLAASYTEANNNASSEVDTAITQATKAKKDTLANTIATLLTSEDNEVPILEKLSIFKNVVNRREKTKDLLAKPQIHPIHEPIDHEERKIKKKDSALLPDNPSDLTDLTEEEANRRIINELSLSRMLNEDVKIKSNDIDSPEILNSGSIESELLQSHSDLPEVLKRRKDVGNIKSTSTDLPEFKPLLPDMRDIKLPENFINSIKNSDYEEYYNDENLYDDYMQSNTMTSYLIEKVQELHDWITSDPDFDKVKNSSKVLGKKTEFRQLLRALNDSLLEGNVSIVMNKLKDIYFGENYTSNLGGKRIILTNRTDMLSFGILTLDVMLLHNIQLMAWENQESLRTKMLKDPDVFAFNALFMDPSKVEAKHNEVQHGNNVLVKRQRQEQDEFDLGKNLFENILEVGMSAARAAIHLGRAYKNTRNVLSQIANKDTGNIQAQLSRNIDGNTIALNHLQTSFNKNDSFNSVASGDSFYTELDCVWLIYCRNLVITAKLNPPFGTMARINGFALRMLAGDLSADRAVDTMLYEALSGWTDLRCNDMFHRCSKANASAIVLDTILQPLKKSNNRGR